MKKILALVLSILMMLTTVALADSPIDAFCPLVEEPAELTIWTYRIANVNDFETQMQTQIMEEKTGVHINWIQAAYDDRIVKRNLSIAEGQESGEYPDIYAGDMNTTEIMEYAGTVFIPIEDYITPEITPNYYRILEENPDVRAMLTAPDGHIYTFLNTDVGVHMLNKNKMYVNTAWLNKYIEDGGAMPETTDEFEEMLIYFKENDMNGNGDDSDEMPFVSSLNGWCGNPLPYLASAFQIIGQDGEICYVEDGEFKCSIITEEFREALSWINSLYEQGLIAEETYVQDATQMSALVNNTDPTQVVVGCFSAAWQGVFVDNNITNYADYTPIPPLEGPDGVRVSAICSEAGIANLFLRDVITVGCENVELAMSYLDLGLCEYQPGEEFSVTGGIEGVTYEWSTEVESMNGLSPTKVSITLPAVQTYTWGNHTMPVWDTEEERFNVYADDVGSSKYLYEGHLAYKPYYKYIGIPLVTWPSDAEVAERVGEISTAIANYYAGATTEFITGVKDIDDDAVWQEYLDTLNTIGMEEYLEKRGEMILG